MAMSLEEHMQQLSLKQKSTHTMYRYHVNAYLHYTAIQLDNEVLEVKGPHAGTKYATVEEWKQSIGATEIEITKEKKSKRMKEKKNALPTDLMEAEAAVEAEAKVEAEVKADAAENPKKSKAKKTKVEQLKLDIPTKRSSITSTRWMRHVYEMMVEANVTITDEIIHAYNNVVACLKKYPLLSTSTPMRSVRYCDGIDLRLSEHHSEHHINGISMHFEYTTPYDTRKVICQEIIQTYLPLYELIKDTVVPFMKNKHLHLNAVKQLEKNKTQMIQLHDYVEQLIKNHKQTLESTYRSIEDKRREIKRLEEMVMKHSM